MSALVRFDAMCTAIAAAIEVDEVKDIRDRTMALAWYARQAQNREAERRAMEIRVRAERSAGELLESMHKMHKAKGGGAAPGACRRSRRAYPTMSNA